MRNVTVLFGKPGAGKGTWLDNFLKEREGQFEVLSVSNLLREAIKNKTEAGMAAKSYMDAGELVPDDIINNLVISWIKSAKKPVFTDGFPRTVAQAEAMLEAGVYPDKVVHFYVDDEVVLQRAKDRIVCEKCGTPYTTNAFKRPKVEGICDKCGGTLIKRKDDNEDVVRNRLKVYESETYPVLDVLRQAGVDIFTIDNTTGQAAGKNFLDLLFA